MKSKKLKEKEEIFQEIKNIHLTFVAFLTRKCKTNTGQSVLTFPAHGGLLLNPGTQRTFFGYILRFEVKSIVGHTCVAINVRFHCIRH